MANRGLFISVSKVKEDTLVSENVDAKYIGSVIEYVQDKEVETVLGSTLFDEIETAILAGTLTGVNKTLVDDHVTPMLKHYVAAEVVETTHYKITNKGTQIQDSEQSSPAFRGDLNRYAEKFRNMAEMYKQRLINYLCENSSSYPSYENPDSGVDVIHPKRDAFKSELFLGNTTRWTSLQDKYRDDYIE